MVKCPFCNAEKGFQKQKTWKFQWYDVTSYLCGKCRGKFNHYIGTTPKGKKSEFIIKLGKKKS